jgi:hypothetical protein
MQRNASGSVLILIVLMLFLVVPLLVVPSRVVLFMMERERAQSVVEAAALVAANDLSKIIINDPTFGYVSLSNYAAIGKATKAADGEPLPVLGINTLVGTLRQNTLLARLLGNQTIGQLAETDRGALQATVKSLNNALSDSLCSAGNATDIHGQIVDPVADVTEYLRANLPADMKLESVQLSSGWLAEGSTSTIPIPQPERLSSVESEDCVGETYKAFTDIPVGRCSFTFAGLDSHSSIVSPGSFQDADDDHICSIIRVDAVISLKEPPLKPFGVRSSSQIKFVACSQPYSQPDVASNGVMTLRFSGGPIDGMQSWRDCLKSGNFRDNQVTVYNVSGGDYPVEPDARMDKIEPDSAPSAAQPTTSQQFAEHLYYWLRNGHLRAQLGDILAMLSAPFPGGFDQVYAYEFTNNGAINRKVLTGVAVPKPVTADAQFSTVADTCTPGGASPVIIFRNNVKYLGTKYGGKHAGQPLAGYPMLSAQNPTDQELATQFGRRSFYRQGLALDIEVGGTKESTAQRDVQSMRSRLFSRKI